MVVEVALYHAAQPGSDGGHGLVPPPDQGLPDRSQRRTHALLRREANELKLTLSVSSTAMSEPEKVERLRTSLTPALTIDQPQIDQTRSAAFCRG